ncbi:ATP-binding protein [Protaetiibacter sp. SSC-01]|uniref:AAA family ATPase n=1 Tax=Protaetiibacter sp. SSC-01 TaxID=2759943 RepID=UPI00165743D6|nr:ATP-binding protein [Protaetiibacter sp. SSC-01]QNO38047.1 ATP-binding protein [Protaetiibacter sp. SSC-01]
MNRPSLHLVFGLPGAGKSTRSRHIVETESAVRLDPDPWIVALGVSLVDYDFRFTLQHQLLAHAGDILRVGANVVVEFGTWSRVEREAVRRVAVDAGARTVLHFVDAPLDELVRRVRERGGPDAEALIADVLIGLSDRFERPDPDEIALYDRYVGPEDDPLAA